MPELSDQQAGDLNELVEVGDLNPKRIAEIAKNWPPESRASMLEYLRTAAQREQIRTRYNDVVDLACAVDPNFVATPALRLIAKRIEVALTKPRHNLLVTLNPQEGKSTLCSIYAPIRALQHNINTKIILATYAEALAFDHSRTCREIIKRHGTNVVDPMTGVEVEDKIGFQLAATNSTVDAWRVANGVGGLVAVGLHGTVTGRSADCISGDTYVHTEHGRVTAATCYSEKHGKIWAYDHAMGVAGWYRVEARRRIGRRRVVTIYTQAGAVLRCTPDHRIYTRRGYIQARDLHVSDQILSIGCSSSVLPVSNRVSDSRLRHPKGRAEGCETVLRIELLQGTVWRRPTRTYSCSGIGMFMVPKGLPYPRCGTKVLHNEVRRSGKEGYSSEPNPPSGSGMPFLSERVSTKVVPDGVLQQGLREQGSFVTNDWVGEFSLQDRNQLRGLVPADATSDLGARPVLLLCLQRDSTSHVVHEEGRSYREVITDCSSHRRGPQKQHSREPDNSLQDMPRDTSQVFYDTISRIVRDGSEEVDVYDFQVEGARNFFANDLLVHNCLIIDDPYKDMAEADSEVGRNKVAEWMRSVARTRLSPRASVIMVMTRWSTQDLAGEIISKERLLDPRFRTWHHINIPAISEEGIPDALNRPPGVSLDSARGRTMEEFEAIRRDVGERIWYSLYEGVPRNPAGGLFLKTWFTPHMQVPDHPVAAVVGIDPADTGKNDETGIIGGYLCGDGTVLLAEDWSGHYTADEWARNAVLMALTIGAREVAMEAYSAATTYVSVLKRAWREIRGEAIAKFEAGETLEGVDRRAMNGGSADQPPFTIYKWRGQARADSVARSSAIRQGFETHRARTVEFRLAVFEQQAADWQSGKHQPDRIAAAIIAHDRLVALGAGQMRAATPINDRNRRNDAPIWLRRKLSG